MPWHALASTRAAYSLRLSRSSLLDLNKHSTLFDHIPEFAELNDQTGNQYEKFRDDWIEKSNSKRISSTNSNLWSSVSY